jgi:aminotransferase
LSERSDDDYARWLAQRGVASVPGSSFFHDPASGRKLIRFAFCKRIDTLRMAAHKLREVAREV